MGEYKLNWRYKAFTCFLLLFVYPIVKVMIMVLGHKISEENALSDEDFEMYIKPRIN